MISTKTTSLHPGDVLAGKWRLDRLLGEGGMAAVWAATHRNGYRAALKILHATLADDDDVRSRFLREGYLANRIQHPGVVPVQDDAVLPDGRALLVMELLEGETLAERWRREDRRLPASAVVTIAREIAAILSAAHAEGIVHRDLKPENVFVTTTGRVRLLDFGIARVAEAEDLRTRTGLMMGTPAFMPPEQALGHVERVSPRSDVFALGATMVTLLSGAIVHDATTLQELLIAACTKPAKNLTQTRPDLPLSLRLVVDRALAFEPEDRWRSADEMAAALDAIPALDVMPTQALPAPILHHLASRSTLSPERSQSTTARPLAFTTPPSPSPRRARRRWAPIATLATAAIAALSISTTAAPPASTLAAAFPAVDVTAELDAIAAPPPSTPPRETKAAPSEDPPGPTPPRPAPPRPTNSKREPSAPPIPSGRPPKPPCTDPFNPDCL